MSASSNFHELRQEIRTADESVADWRVRDLWNVAQNELDHVRQFGDLVLAAYFEGHNSDSRETKRTEYASTVVSGEFNRKREWLEAWRHKSMPFIPFHWELEFPEVFGRRNPGFDAIFGNPPFFWGNRIGKYFGSHYRDWLLSSNVASNGNADLVVYFLRLGFEKVRSQGCIGLIATNSVSQADTREGGLKYLVGERSKYLRGDNCTPMAGERKCKRISRPYVQGRLFRLRFIRRS